MEKQTDKGFISEKDRRILEARKFTLFSDAFLSVALNDIPACQHVLQILTGRPDLKVKNLKTQYTVSKVTSHDARLDVLAEDGDKVLYNLEIQRWDTVDHIRRTRFYGSLVDSEFLQKGKKYFELPEVNIIYISETDIWKQGKTVYSVEKYLNELGKYYDDGHHVTYVNAEIDDGTEIARLMSYFKTADPMDMSHGALSERVHFLKCEKGGHEIMCEITDRWIQEARQSEKHKIAINLSLMGMAVENIALAVNEKVDLVKLWLDQYAIMNHKEGSTFMTR